MARIYSTLCEFVYVYGPLARYVKLRVAHAPGMPGTFSQPLTSKKTASYRSRHASRHMRDARSVTHVGMAKPQRRGKRSRHSGRMSNPQFHVSGKRRMEPIRSALFDTVFIRSYKLLFVIVVLNDLWIYVFNLNKFHLLFLKHLICIQTPRTNQDSKQWKGYFGFLLCLLTRPTAVICSTPTNIRLICYLLYIKTFHVFNQSRPEHNN